MSASSLNTDALDTNVLDTDALDMNTSNTQALIADSRLARRFAALKAADRAALVTYVMAGDPDPETSRDLLERLPAAGADIIELGMPFSDPMADGVAIQRAGQRALANSQTLFRTLERVRDFRRRDDDSPVKLPPDYVDNPLRDLATGLLEHIVRGSAEAARREGIRALLHQ